MPSKNEQYEYLEHTADAKFRAYGKSLEETFENAALAMFNVMIDTEKVSGEKATKVRVSSPDLENLLVDWLSELLFLFEVEATIFWKFKVLEIKKEEGKYFLSGQAFGEAFNPEIHPFETEIKAVTYNQLLLEKTENGWLAQLVVDI
ncbi:MAG: archease [Methanosarcinaceae archaeon]|nr:archease [Methanosarcinaceae archaeon]MDD4330722.1 archease [Methanosarcinaceae archaeon]MDD4748490.1 archease [Methanosarcinaceae archaeon]